MTGARSQELVATTLEWLQGSLGPDFLNYVLGRSLGDAPITPLDLSTDEDRASAILALSGIRNHLPPDLDDEGKEQAVRYLLLHIDTDKTAARALRENFVLDLRPKGSDEVEERLLDVAIEVYPALLLPPDLTRVLVVTREDISSLVSVVLHRTSDGFIRAALEAEDLPRLFSQDEVHTGRHLTFQSNSGTGGMLQLAMFPDVIIRAAWKELRDSQPSVKTFAEKVIQRFRAAREALNGRSGVALAKLAFAGALLPSGTPLKFGDGVVRPVTDAERCYAPESIRGQIGGQVGDAEPVTVNYDGDILLEYQFPYKVRLGEPEFPPAHDMRPPVAIDRIALRLRFSLMVAVDRDPRAQLVHTWEVIDEPLSALYSVSWSDPRQGPGFMPIRLTPEDVDEWLRWYERLSASRVDRIELALSRILRAVAERRDLSDVLIDSVIAWENLFGTKEGEPTFRVTMCLAKLLRSSPQDRQALKSKLGRIYALRSKIVHGSANLKPEDHSYCREALDVAIEAIKVLVSERTDILDMPDGAVRSAALLLGE